MIKAAIFDLNGIFLQSPMLSSRFEQDFGISKEIFVPKLLEIMDKSRKPNAEPAFTYWEPVLHTWNVNLTEREFWDYWFGAEIPSERMINFAKELREKGIKVFILSNNFKERSLYYDSYQWIHEAVDRVYFSWQTGCVNPDPQAWKLVLSENNLAPEDCIYFDDQQKNLDASISLGIKSYLFTNEVELEKIINENL